MYQQLSEMIETSAVWPTLHLLTLRSGINAMYFSQPPGGNHNIGLFHFLGTLMSSLFMYNQSLAGVDQMNIYTLWLSRCFPISSLYAAKLS